MSEILISRSSLIRFLSMFAIILIVIHTVILCIYYYIGDPDQFDFVQMFDLDMEANIPTLFSSLLFMLNAFLFYILSRKETNNKNKYNYYWLGLSALFAFLSFDESAKIHENIGDLTERFVDATGFLHYPWVLSYSLLVVFLGIVYFRFFWSMERKLFYRFVLAAVIFLTGALGFELLGAQESSLYGTDSPLYSLYYTIEESLEMFGLIYLVSILSSMLGNVTLRFSK